MYRVKRSLACAIALIGTTMMGCDCQSSTDYNQVARSMLYRVQYIRKDGIVFAVIPNGSQYNGANLAVVPTDQLPLIKDKIVDW